MIGFTEWEAKQQARLRPYVWDSGITIVETPRVLIPHTYLGVCKTLQQEYPDHEFSLLAKSEWCEHGLLIREDYVIPKQTVDYARVDYDEPLAHYRKQGYNVVLHAHPPGLDKFSREDVETINAHFDASILYNSGGFVRAVIRTLPADGVQMHVPADIQFIAASADKVDGLENIKIREYPHRARRERYYDPARLFK